MSVGSPGATLWAYSWRECGLWVAKLTWWSMGKAAVRVYVVIEFPNLELSDTLTVLFGMTDQPKPPTPSIQCWCCPKIYFTVKCQLGNSILSQENGFIALFTRLLSRWFQLVDKHSCTPDNEILLLASPRLWEQFAATAVAAGEK